MSVLDVPDTQQLNEKARTASVDLSEGDITSDSLLRIQQETAAASLAQLLLKHSGQTERTLLLVKPEAVKHKTMIEARLKKEGFFILQVKNKYGKRKLVCIKRSRYTLILGTMKKRASLIYCLPVLFLHH